MPLLIRGLKFWQEKTLNLFKGVSKEQIQSIK